jgi:hypothetical protein
MILRTEFRAEMKMRRAIKPLSILEIHCSNAGLLLGVLPSTSGNSVTYRPPPLPGVRLPMAAGRGGRL